MTFQHFSCQSQNNMLKYKLVFGPGKQDFNPRKHVFSPWKQSFVVWTWPFNCPPVNWAIIWSDMPSALGLVFLCIRNLKPVSQNKQSWVRLTVATLAPIIVFLNHYNTFHSLTMLVLKLFLAIVPAASFCAQDEPSFSIDYTRDTFLRNGKPHRWKI